MVLETGLVGRARAGDLAAFEALVAPLIEPASQLARALLRDWHEAEDAVQEATFKAWRAVGRLHESTTSPRAWFLTIVANEARSRRRGRWWRVVRLAEPRSDSTRPGPEEHVSLSVDLERAMGRLKEADRLILFMHFYLDLPLDEIGRVLGAEHSGGEVAHVPCHPRHAASAPVPGGTLMDDRLRHELIAYFDRELGQPPAGIRDRVLRSLSEQRLDDGSARAGRRIGLVLQLTGAAAVVVAIVAFAAFLMLIRLHRPAGVPAAPHASALPTVAPTPAVSATYAPTVVSTPFSAPDSVPAIVFRDPADRAQTDAVAWDGFGLGRLAASGTPNPAGTLFVTPGLVTDRQGRTVATFASDGKAPPTWADDGRTLCRTTPQTGPVSGTPSSLQLSAVGGGWRTVGQYGTTSESSGVSVAACSTLNDRAVLVGRMYQGPSVRQLWVVQLSTGRVLWSRSFPQDGTTIFDVVASRDGASVAVGQSTCCPHTAFTTDVYGPSGALVRSFDGHAGGYAGSAFSWDGSRLILAAGADESRVTMVDVRTGTTVWQAPAGQKVAGVEVEPLAGGRLGIALNGTGAFAGPDGYVSAADLYLVDASGQAQHLPMRIRP